MQGYAKTHYSIDVIYIFLFDEYISKTKTKKKKRKKKHPSMSKNLVKK